MARRRDNTHARRPGYVLTDPADICDIEGGVRLTWRPEMHDAERRVDCLEIMPDLSPLPAWSRLQPRSLLVVWDRQHWGWPLLMEPLRRSRASALLMPDGPEIEVAFVPAGGGPEPVLPDPRPAEMDVCGSTNFHWFVLRPLEALAIAVDDSRGPACLTLAFDVEHYAWRGRCGGKEAFVPADYAISGSTRNSTRTSRSGRRRGVGQSGLAAVALRDVTVWPGDR